MYRDPRPLSGAARLLPLLPLVLVACGRSGGSGDASGPGGVVGAEYPRPGGGTYFLDDNRAGGRSRPRLVEVSWGRLVDVYALDEDGAVLADPEFEDLVIRDELVGDRTNYLLETNPVTFQTRLVVLRTRGVPDDGSGTFESLLSAARQPLPPILPKGVGKERPGPFSLVPRNATIVLQFDDLLDDSFESFERLPDLIRVTTGPHATPHAARFLFDRNHGGLRSGVFHSTRVLIDTTVSEAEAAISPYVLPINMLGLPGSRVEAEGANAVLRIATVVDESVGQFELLRSLGGAPLATKGGPWDEASSTADVVRAFRTGNDQDLNGGYLLDFELPELVGGWRLTVTDSEQPGPGRWTVALEFTNDCRTTPARGDVLQVGSHFLEVVEADSLIGGRVPRVQLVQLAGPEIASPDDLLGAGLFLRPYDPRLPVAHSCWVTAVPVESTSAGVGLSAHSSIQVRFSEPMRPDSAIALETVRMLRGDVGTQPSSRSLVVAGLRISQDYRLFTFTPALPLNNSTGSLDYTFEIVGGEDGVVDLAGNSLRSELLSFPFELDPSEPPVRNSSVVLAFSEQAARGQFTVEGGRVKGRPVAYGSASCDPKTGTVRIMTPFTPGVQTPLSPLGSKLQAVWRYADFGWSVYDESKYDLDVVGLSWASANGVVAADYYPYFAVHLAHSEFLPDEYCGGARGPAYPDSGIARDNTSFAANVLVGPHGGIRQVHPANLGYRIDPAETFVNANDEVMVPFPVNRAGGPLRTYTWRDTTILAEGGQGGAGIPMAIEANPPLSLAPLAGELAASSRVPSIGLPLLWQISCYPTTAGIGLNPLKILIACRLWPTPNFRAYSTGGVNVRKETVTIDPEKALFPRGGFNPSSSPPGKRTARSADNSFYVGQLDYVVRVTRIHTVWVDSLNFASDFAEPIVEPEALFRPAGTDLVLDFRGATAFLNTLNHQFDATRIDAYGDVDRGQVLFLDEDARWKDDIDDIDGSRFFQVRITFVGDPVTREVPVLQSVGIAFEPL